MLTTRRRPSLNRWIWITTWMAEAICPRSDFCGRSIPVMPTMCSSRVSASRAAALMFGLAWIVGRMLVRNKSDQQSAD